MKTRSNTRKEEEKTRKKKEEEEKQITNNDHNGTCKKPKLEKPKQEENDDTETIKKPKTSKHSWRYFLATYYDICMSLLMLSATLMFFSFNMDDFFLKRCIVLITFTFLISIIRHMPVINNFFPNILWQPIFMMLLWSFLILWHCSIFSKNGICNNIKNSIGGFPWKNKTL